MASPEFPQYYQVPKNVLSFDTKFQYLRHAEKNSKLCPEMWLTDRMCNVIFKKNKQISWIGIQRGVIQVSDSRYQCQYQTFFHSTQSDHFTDAWQMGNKDILGDFNQALQSLPVQGRAPTMPV